MSEFKDVGAKIDAALSGMDDSECRKLLGIEDLEDGEFLVRLAASGANVERLLVGAIANSVIQSRQNDMLQQLMEAQQTALDGAADALKRLQKELNRVAGRPEGANGTASDHVEALKSLAAKAGQTQH